MKKLSMFVAVPFMAVLCAVFFLSACSDRASGPQLDLSSSEAFELSVQQITEQLDEQTQGEFSDALSYVMFDEMMQGMQEGLAESEIEQAIYQRLHGKTASEVIADFEQNVDE